MTLKPRNLVTRRRAQLDATLGEVLLVDGVPANVLPTLEREAAAPPSRHPLPLVDRALDFFRGIRPSGRVRALAEQREQSRELPRGAPPVDVSVQPVWDSRLVNMRDFCAARSTGADGGPALAFPVTATLGYVVPQGYTGFLRGFRYFFDPMAAGRPRQFLATLLIDDLVVPDFVNMPFGPAMNDDQDTFVIARAGQTFNLRVEVTAPGPFATDLLVFFYGHLRLADGRPANQDVGERIRQPPVIVAPPAPATAPASSSTPECPPGSVWDPALQRCMRPRGPLGQARRK